MQESHAPSLAQSGGLESSTRPCAVYIASSLMYCGKPNQHQDRRSSEWTYKILKRPLSEVKSVEVRRHWICDAVDCGQLWQWLVVPVVTLSSWRRRGTGKSDGFLLYITTTSRAQPPPQNTELHPGTSAALHWSILALLIPAASLQPQSGPRPEQNRELPYNQSAANLIEKRFLPLLIASLVFT